VINHCIVMSAAWDQLTDQDWDTMIETNLSSVWRATRAVIPHLVAQGGGSIVITASAAGLVPFYGLLSYVAAKHGVIGLVKALATELAPLWIRVNAICPGNVSTPMFHNQYIYDMYAGGPGGTVEDVEFPTKTVHMMPISWVEPEDVSHAVVFLASDEGKYVTGTAMPIDGGMTIQPPGVPPIAATRLAELSAAATPAP
jgi:NAD(P)-dependent dehydrogenase (short-subunit alcohol dehydrogenase family)